MNKKLQVISKIMLVILKLLLVIIPLWAIIAWTFLGTSLSWIFLGYVGSIEKFTPLTRGLGFLSSVTSMLPLLIGLILLLKLFKNYIKQNIFSIENAKIYKKLGYLCLFSALLFQPISQIFYSLSISLNNPVGQRSVSIGFTSANFTAILGGVMLVVIAYVMQIGHDIKEEQQLTI